MDKYQEIEQAKNEIAIGEALNRLMNNSDDFKKVILNEYLREYALSLIYNKCGANNIEEIQGKIDAIGFFKKFLQEVEFKAEAAKALLEDLEQI